MPTTPRARTARPPPCHRRPLRPPQACGSAARCSFGTARQEAAAEESGNISRRTSSTLPRPILTCKLQSRLGQIGIRLSAAGTCATDQRRSRSATSARRRSSSASISCETCAQWDCANSQSPFAPRRACRASGNLDSSSGRI
ncbi:hypothetical protein Ctob_008401 [Chrysochromulina tobinii]|uniref:Uncharacterized protein n=1 Tax=Chrysochromulina tobinii TaxID=1460289 RepID=A0A0M0JZH4_9EUKA|nr:hypothetical protein Ctob_008401 [Chrysochromulina tobinii]|eukprot:KOO31528.1 hypothetical protein Ctob_008401 [Chrysochromulina sp. CCMP291]